MVIEVELWPHWQDHLFFETIYGLTREGRLPPRGPREGLALLALCHRHGFFMAGPPRAVIRPVAAVAAALAAILQIDPWAPRFAARAPQASPAAFLHLSSDAKVAP